MSWRDMKFWQFLHTIQPSLLITHSPRSVLRSSFFLEPNHCRTVSNSGSSLSFCPVGHMHFHQYSSGGYTYFLFQTLIVFDNSWVFYFCPLRCAHGRSVQDSLHCLWGEIVYDTTQGASCGIISAFLVFQPKVIFSQGIHPTVPSGI